MEKGLVNERDEYAPMVNRHYERQLQYPFASYGDGYYPINSYYYNRYNTYSTHHVHDVSQSSVS